MENKSGTFEDGRIAWINELMQKCSVRISSEQQCRGIPVSLPDAKKREYPFHKVDRPGTISKKRLGEAGPNDYLKLLSLQQIRLFYQSFGPLSLNIDWTIIAVGSETGMVKSW